jgi:hypothetical protein
MNKIKIPVEHTNSDPNSIRHSDEMQDIISSVPAKFIRWGMFLFLCVFLMIIGLAAFIHIPEVFNATIKINNSLTIEALVPQTDLSKLQKGQEVLINFKSNLHGPYKTLKGKIINFSDMSVNYGGVTAYISIERKSDSSSLKSGMRGDAIIIINDFSILKRIFRNFFP